MTKTYLLMLITLCSLGCLAQGSINMQLIGHYNDTSLTRVGDQIWNDVMGWKDTVKNREYMIAGTTDSIYFFDITDPSQIRLCARFWGTNRGCINRDYYPYHHYMYTTSDQCTDVGNLQIFDMQYLPDSVVKVYEDDTLGALTHTIFIEEKTQRMYMQLNKIRNPLTGQFETHPMDIISLADPVAPVKIGTISFPPPYGGARVHESYVRDNIAYCSSENAGLFIFDVTDASNPQLISAITPPYPANAYNHSCWLDSSSRYLLFCDETPAGVGMKVYDLENISEPKIVGAPFKEEGSPHNAYWYGKYAYASMYYGGVQVYDMENLNAPSVVAYYDTYPVPYTDNYRGCWGVWPFLPSGVILASDMTYGLFILRKTDATAINEGQPSKLPLRAWPNPFTNTIHFTVPASGTEEANLEVYDLQGKLVASNSLQLNAGVNQIEQQPGLIPGLYNFKLTTKEYVYTARLLKQ